MAAAAFKPFQNGFRLLDGTKFNRLFTGQEQIQSLNLSGVLTLNGGLNVSGADIAPATKVTGIGASRASATAVPKTAVNVWVTNSTSAQGISLPALVSGQALTVWPLPTIGVKVYTAAGQVINALASATALVLASAKAATFYSADGVKIRVQKGG